MHEFLKNRFQLKENECDQVLSISRKRNLKQGEEILRPGNSVNRMFFIEQGLVRGYRIIDGDDVTHHFFLEGWFGTDYESLLTGNAGELFLESMLDSTIYEFDKKSFLDLCNQSVRINKIRTAIAEKAYLHMVNRMKAFQITDLKERYLNLIERNPHLFNIIPQKHIASYLGVAPQSLSRIKKDVVR
ncbi:MAG: Crp/Fnr family transcriptional regulator [Saprospiraceae bacterium]|nr:Crp/Fnr family transcriptional regulator [Saprospiraceae bacterium]